MFELIGITIILGLILVAFWHYDELVQGEDDPDELNPNDIDPRL